MKINEVIVEALNTKTGTPNGGTRPGYQNDEVHVDPRTGEADFSGVKQAAQGASMLGRGISRGAKAAGRFAQSFIPGTNANQMRQATAAAKPAMQADKENVKLALSQWQQYLQQRSSVADMEVPATFQAELKKWANARFPSAQDAAKVNTAHPNNPGSVVKYITDMYNTAMANRSVGITGSAPADDQPTNTKPNTPSSIIVPDKVGGGARQAPDTKQADANTQDIKQHDLAPGVEIVSQEPIIVKYKNKEYGLNDNGQWVHFGSSRVPHESFQQFLDRQAGY